MSGMCDYTFDELNRLKTVKPVGSSVPIATYVYDGVGNRESVTHDNGVVTSYGYNRRNRLTSIQHKLGATLLLGVAYTLDASGLRTGITETGQIERSVSYTYDGVKRLTNETVTQLGNDRRTAWTYDRTGNRLTQVKSIGPVGSPTGTATTAYVYDANDRLETETVSLTGSVPGATAGLTTYTYDAAGNTTKKVSPTETIDTIYDDANRMAELQTLAGDVTRYAYAHDGIRLSQTRDATGANPVTTHYLIDPNTAYAQVIEEVEQVGSGALSVKALYAVGDDRVRRYTPAVAGSGGNPGVPAGLRYYHADGLGSTRLLSDETGAATDRTTFEAFGEIDAAASMQTSDNSFLYTGEQLDLNTGFYYLRARYMDPRAGRFAQQDAFMGIQRHPASIHKYAYGNNNPISMTDPSGNVSIAFVATSAAVIAVGAGILLADRYLPTFDKQKKVFVDFSKMNTGENNKFAVETEVLSILRNAYAEFGVQFSTSDRSARRSVILGGTGGGVWGDYGKTVFLTARVWTDSVIEDGIPHITRHRKLRKLSDAELGMAIGNFAAHEVGHSYGLDHIPRASYLTPEEQPLTIMDDNQLPEAMRLPWAPESLAYLRARFR
jgi:RHS repeat-associated protein